MAVLFVYLCGIVANHCGGVVDIELLDILTDLSIDFNDSHCGMAKILKGFQQQNVGDISNGVVQENDITGKTDSYGA